MGLEQLGVNPVRCPLTAVKEAQHIVHGPAPRFPTQQPNLYSSFRRLPLSRQEAVALASERADDVVVLLALVVAEKILYRPNSSQSASRRSSNPTVTGSLSFWWTVQKVRREHRLPILPCR